LHTTNVSPVETEGGSIMRSVRARSVLGVLPALAAGVIGCGGEKGPTQPAGPTKLAFAVQPSTVTSGAAITPAVQVTVQDDRGNTLTTSTANVTLVITSGTGTGGAVLGGTLTRAAVSGVATFNNLTIDKAGSDYTLSASAPQLTGARSVPFAVTLAFAAVSTGGAHTCGVTTGGEGYCWGDNSNGEVGDGTRTQRTSPVAIVGGLTFGVVSAGRGFGHTCGVTTGGAAYCWGLNAEGELGDGTKIFRSSPVPVVGGLAFAEVSAGYTHTCGVTTSGAAYCWGDNGGGELGDGTNTQRTSPVAVLGGLTFATVSAGDHYTCGVTAGGAAYCWGLNSYGELGDGTTISRTSPVAVMGGLTFATVSATAYAHSCGVTTGGAGYCWGYNTSGEVGDGTTTQRTSPVAVLGGLTFAALSAGYSVTCGVTTGGAAYCWGRNAFGELGDGTMTQRTSPVSVKGGLTIAVVSAAGGHTCGVTTEGAAYCWGWNAYGQLGDGTTTDRLTPTRVSP
jgi:alpha-tubulin suppressor-like RCC1 family protein